MKGDVTRTDLPQRLKDLQDGVIRVEDLTDEELTTGRFLTPTGQLGQRAKFIPREVHQELLRRLLNRGADLWREGYLTAIRVHLEIMGDVNMDPSVRLKAAQYVISKLEPEKLKVEISVEDPVETLFRAILNDPNGLIEPGMREIVPSERVDE